MYELSAYEWLRMNLFVNIRNFVLFVYSYSINLWKSTKKN